MVQHVFVSTNPPYVPIRLRFEPNGPELDVTGLIDTGFEGFVSLPPLRLPEEVQPVQSRYLQMADGTVTQVDIYRASAQLIGLEPVLPVSIAVGSREVLIGLAFTNNFRVTFDHGREVMVEP